MSNNDLSQISRNEIYIPGVEFKLIRKLASNELKVENQRLELYNQKKEMHSVSQKAVKNWGNTLFGHRKKRLISIEEKARLAEV